MTELRQRTPTIVCLGFLAFLRKQPCCVCGNAAPNEAAHIRMACLSVGKEYTGKAQKPDDRWATPLCAGCHRTDNDAQHSGSEEAFWIRVAKYPFKIAETLYARYLAEGGKPGEPKPSRAGRAIDYQKLPKLRADRPKPRKGPKRKIPSRKLQSRKGFNT